MASSTVTLYVNGGNAVFNKVEINLKGGYNSLDGKFTAPTGGLYLFYFSLNLSGTNVEVKMYVRHRIYFKTRDYKNYPTGTFMVQLNTGDQVYMKLSSSTNVNGNLYTWFGGHLINEM